MDPEETQRDWEAYQQVLTLWQGENPIKTTKLQVLMAVNGGLLAILQVAGGFTRGNWSIYLAGALLSLVWTLSIGRSSYYQELWDRKLRRFAEAHPGDARFRVHDVSDVRGLPGNRGLRFVGSVRSKYYLLGAPIVFFLSWLAALVLFALR